MTLRVYLAGGSRELDRVLPMVERLESSGLVVLTYRWFDAVQKHGVGRDHELTREEAARHADADLEWVRDAQLVWVLWPEARSVGAALEYGYAIAAGSHTVVTGPTAHECIFTALANFRDYDDLVGLHEVLRVAAQQRPPEAISLGEARAAVDRGLCVKSIYPDSPHFDGCVRAIRDGELRVWDPRYPSRGWLKLGIPGHWPDGARFLVVPDPVAKAAQPETVPAPAEVRT